MLQPGFLDGSGDAVKFEGFLQYPTAAREMAAHDRMFGMDLVERQALILDVCAQETCAQLIFHFFDALFSCVAKEKPDHTVLKNTIDEIVDNFSQYGFAAQLLKTARGDAAGFF